MLRTILSVSGKAGLYKLVSRGNNVLIAESLADNKRTPIYAREKVIALSDIAIYTDAEEIPLGEVFEAVKAKYEGKAVDVIPSKVSITELKSFMEEILPNYDRDRVYPSDMRKLISWYNILVGVGLTNFVDAETSTDEEKEE